MNHSGIKDFKDDIYAYKGDFEDDKVYAYEGEYF